MGYILPINSYQYMQYSNRIQYRKENLEDFGPVKGTLPAFPIALKERMDRHIPVFEAKKNLYSEYSKNTFRTVERMKTSHITGKGRIIDEYV